MNIIMKSIPIRKIMLLLIKKKSKNKSKPGKV